MKKLGSNLINALSEFKVPFGKANLKAIYLNYSKRTFEEEWIWKGRIQFVNGSTEGEQRFEEEDFEILIRKVHDFIERI